MPTIPSSQSPSPQATVRLVTTDPTLEPRVRQACVVAAMRFGGLVPPARLTARVVGRAGGVVILGIGDTTDAVMTVAEDVHRIFPGHPLLLVGDDLPPDGLASLLRLGACGWLPAAASASEIARALQAILKGELWLGRRQMRRVLESMVADHRDLLVGTLADSAGLTPREREVAERAARGESNKEVARHLGISELTVKAHLHNAYGKLHIRHRMELLVRREAEAVADA